MYARVQVRRAPMREKQRGGRRNGDIYETRRHFIDLPGDAPLVLYNARPSPARARRAFPPAERSGFEGSNLAAGSDEGRRRRHRGGGGKRNVSLSNLVMVASCRLAGSQEVSGRDRKGENFIILRDLRVNIIFFCKYR